MYSSQGFYMYMYFIGSPSKTAGIYTKCFISEPITELIDTLARYPLPVKLSILIETEGLLYAACKMYRYT